MVCATWLTGAALLAGCFSPRPPGWPDRGRLARPTNFFSQRIQLRSDGDKVTGEEDLDGDGRDDCWRARWQRGSGYGGMTINVQRACRGAVVGLTTVAPVRPFVVATPLDLELARSPALTEHLLDMMLGLAHRRSLASAPPSDPAAIDPSFRWLLDYVADPPLGDDGPLRGIRAYDAEWTPSPPALPPSQFAIIDDPADAGLVRALVSPASGILNVPRQGQRPYALILYRASHHGPLAPVASCLRWRLFATGHAVLAYDPEITSTSWVFIDTDYEHPRYASLRDAQCSTGLVVVERRGTAGRDLVVAAPDLGRFGHIALGPDDSWKLDDARHVLVVADQELDLLDLRERLALPPPSPP